MGRCFPVCCWPKSKKVLRLYEEGQERIDRELDIVKIIKTLRMSKIFLKSSLITPEVRFAILHAEQNYINIDLSDDDDSDGHGGDANQDPELHTSRTNGEPMLGTLETERMNTDNQFMPSDDQDKPVTDYDQIKNSLYRKIRDRPKH